MNERRQGGRRERAGESRLTPQFPAGCVAVPITEIRRCHRKRREFGGQRDEDAIDSGRGGQRRAHGIWGLETTSDHGGDGRTAMS